MLISYTPEYGFGWSETLLEKKPINHVYESYGNVGVYYLLSFGHPLSANRIEFDLEARDLKVLDEIKFRKLGNGKNKNRFVDRFYQTPEFEAGSAEINKATCIPDALYLDELNKRVEYYQSQLSKGAYSAAEQDQKSKDLDNDAKLFKLITSVRTEIRVQETHLQKMTSKTGMVSLDEFFT